MLQPTAPTINQFPDRLIVNWRRLSSGLWRISEGDISAAYSADIFPRVKTFRHENHLFTNCGCTFSGTIRAVVSAYPLFPKVLDSEPVIRPYSYEARECKFRGETFQLGPPVLFESSDPTVQEWRSLYRALYADGGYFASQATYGEFLREYGKDEGNAAQARLLELEHPFSQLGKNDLSLNESFVQAEAPLQAEFKL